MSSAGTLQISFEALPYGRARTMILCAVKDSVVFDSAVTSQLIPSKPIPCQAVSEASSAVSEGLSFLYYAM